MILLKSFLRKKKTNIYLKIFTTITIIILLLNSISSYITYEQDKLNHDTTSLVLFAKENHDDMLEKEDKIKSYRNALGFEIGIDNDIIYNPNIIMNGTSVEYEDIIDETKLNWNSLLYNNVILTFSSKSCGTSLNDNETILYLSKENYNENYLNKYLNQKINFKYNNQEISLIIKNILEPKTFNYICISDKLFNNLVKENQKFIYDIETKDYKALENLKKKWANLENNDFFNIETQTFYKTTESNDRINILNKMANILIIANFISLFIYFLILIFVSTDLISDEENNMILLKQIGYNKLQNMFNLLKNVFVLNIISLSLSLIIYKFIIFILNIMFKINLNVLNYKFIFLYLSFVIIVEYIVLIIYTKNIDDLN